jgi:hypothetical protein
MRYAFRLAELLGHVPDPRKRPGTIKAIVEYTGLDRHQVSALLKNEVKYIPLQALSRLCDYLIEQGHVSPDELPGALFAVEAEDYWELLARRKRLELCLGVRCEDQQSQDTAWVVASDSVLLGELLNGVSTLGGTAKQRYGVDGTGKPHPEQIKQSLVWSPGQRPQEEFRQRARDQYDDFGSLPGDKALICIGSVKSNPVAEMIMAEAFGCEPFVSQDQLPQVSGRSCPIFLRYRSYDPHHDSCSGGLQLAQDAVRGEPGIYYEKKDGSWGLCKWDDKHHDAAFVFYVHRESQGRLEMALAGFSGRSTRLLAKTLATRAQEFWPPQFESHGVQVGAFVVQYTLNEPADQVRDILTTDMAANTTEVIALDSDVLARRFALHTAGGNRAKPASGPLTAQSHAGEANAAESSAAESNAAESNAAESNAAESNAAESSAAESSTAE